MSHYVTGPAAKACGGCHCASLINEDNNSELIPLIQHMQQGGYMIDAGDAPTATLNTVIDQIMPMFK